MTSEDRLPVMNQGLEFFHFNNISNQTISFNKTFQFSTIKTGYQSYLEWIFYIKLVCFLFGSIGNIFCIFVWSKRQFLTMSRSPACLVLSMANACHVTLIFTSAVLHHTTGYYYMH